MKKRNYIFEFILFIFTSLNKKHFLSFFLFLFFSVVAFFGVKSLKIDFSSLAIFSSNSIDTIQLKEIEKKYHNSYPIFVLIENKSKAKPEENRKAIIQQLKNIANTLSTNSFIDKVIVQKSDVLWLEKLLLLVNDQQYQQIENFFQENSLNFFLESINRKMQDFSDSETDSQEIVKQLKSIKTILEGLVENKSKDFFQQEYKNLLLNDSYFIDSSGRYSYITILPNFSINDSQECIKNTAIIEQQIASIISDDFKYSLTGVPVRTRDEVSNGEKTLGSASRFLVVFLVIFLYFAFKMKTAPVILLATVGTGTFWTLALVGYIWGKISNIEVLILIALLGISIDFAIHYINSFLYFFNKIKKTFQESIILTTNKIGGSILATLFTTVVGFLILCFSNLEILKKIGVISAISLIIQVFTLFLFLPICLKVRQFFIKTADKEENSLIIGKKINNFFFKLNVLQKKTGFVLFILTILTVAIFAFFSFQIKGIDNPMSVYNDEIGSVKTQNKMNKVFNLSTDVMLVNTTSLEEARQLHQKIKQLPTVRDVHSIVDLLPTKDFQKERMLKINEFKNRVKNQNYWSVEKEKLQNNIEIFSGNVSELMEFLSFADDNENIIKQIEDIFSFNEKTNFITSFQFAIQTNKVKMEKKFHLSSMNFIKDFLGSSKEEITLEKISPRLKKNFISLDGQNFLITIYPQYDPWPTVFRETFIKSIKDVSEKATGFVVLGNKLIEIITKEAVILISCSFFFIFLFLIVILRSVTLSVITILPLVLSTIMVIGTMAMLGIEFDFINILIILILIGIGTDYSLHISEGYVKEQKDLSHVVQQVGNGIFLSSITSIIGFSAIIFSNISSIKYTGVFVCVGVLFCYLFTMNTQVFLLHVFRRKLKVYKKITSEK